MPLFQISPGGRLLRALSWLSSVTLGGYRILLKWASTVETAFWNNKYKQTNRELHCSHIVMANVWRVITKISVSGHVLPFWDADPTQKVTAKNVRWSTRKKQNSCRKCEHFFRNKKCIMNFSRKSYVNIKHRTTGPRWEDNIKIYVIKKREGIWTWFKRLRIRNSEYGDRFSRSTEHQTFFLSMNYDIFWDVIQCLIRYKIPTFRRNVLLHLQGRKIKPTNWSASRPACWLLDPEDGGSKVPPIPRWTPTGLHGVTSQEIVLFFVPWDQA
jgi:hypothetical protein